MLLEAAVAGLCSGRRQPTRPGAEATRRQVADQFARLEEALHFAFRRAQLTGELAADAEPRSLARFLLAALHGLRVMGKATPEPSLLTDIAATTLARLPFTDSRSRMTP